jgi:hypothetical protein
MHWLKGKLYIVENVRAEVCQECGERYFHATTLDEIDHQLRSSPVVLDHLLVDVVGMPA